MLPSGPVAAATSCVALGAASVGSVTRPPLSGSHPLHFDVGRVAPETDHVPAFQVASCGPTGPGNTSSRSFMSVATSERSPVAATGMAAWLPVLQMGEPAVPYETMSSVAPLA